MIEGIRDSAATLSGTWLGLQSLADPSKVGSAIAFFREAVVKGRPPPRRKAQP